MAQIDKPDTYFNTVLYTGDGTSSNAITGVGFQPDFLWIKERNNIRSHQLMDVVRGASVRLQCDLTNVETSSALNSFDSDGFDVNGSTLNGTNFNTGTYVAWNWLASNTTASNTDGGLNSTVSVNQTSGFSTMTFTGDGNTTTVGHGLGKTPDFWIFKNRTTTGQWWAYKTISGVLNYFSLNNTDVGNTSGLSLPTNQVVSVNGSVAPIGDDMVCYAFTNIKGFSKAGEYQGNGSSDGTFVYTGFKPAWIMVKRADATDVWHILDNKRNTFNQNADWKYLDPASSGAEYDNNQHDFLSNGFKMRAAGTNSNASGGTYIYMAFAENPLVGTNNIPATAR